MPTLQPYTILKNRHQGETAWLVGAGTSLLGWYLHEKRDRIFKDVVITTNSGIFAMPWGLPHCNKEIDYEVDTDPDKRYWISNDALCRRWSWWNYVKKCKCTKIVRNSWKNYYDEIPKFLYFWPRPTSEDIINSEDEGLAYCSSIPTACDLAIFMKCSKIYLLGLDQYMIGEKSHWWQYLERKIQPTRIDRVMALHSQQQEAFKYNDMCFPALKKYADLFGVEIFNCNPQSHVEVFPKILLDEVLNV